jgi:murein DD-endopeptidase MepM/ murein hydrolase activator NlpD
LTPALVPIHFLAVLPSVRRRIQKKGWKNEMKKITSRALILYLGIALSVLSIFLFTPYFELVNPDIRPVSSIDPVGQHKTVAIVLSDGNSGLRHMDVAVMQDGKSYTLAAEDYPERGTKEKSVTVEINPLNLKFHEGDATVTVTAVDHSLFKNTARLVQKVTIDFSPPQVSLLSSYHNVNTGGSCLAIYSISKEPEQSGVRMGNDFFPGYPVVLADKKAFMVYFPIPLDMDRNAAKPAVYAKDKAGNEALLSIPVHVKPAKFRKDVVDISERFMTQKMPEFQQRESSLQGKSLVETFAYVNNVMREENFKTIQSICGKSAGSQLWQGPFLRMKNAAPMALFGDRRTYTYQKKKIGESIHLGVDLASTANAPIEAANSGAVVFAGNRGIYGNAVIIDHGLGVFSLYGHMSDVKAKAGQQVAKSDVIGVSGFTGLAGGDHLHFSMIVGQRFVSPLEWWDSHWIADNVEKKLSEASQHL